MAHSTTGSDSFNVARCAWITFGVFWFMISCPILGLSSQQLNLYGRTASNYPDSKYYGALVTLLITSILSIIIAFVIPWIPAVGKVIIMVIFAVLFGTGAGLIEQTPFGHSLNCRNNIIYFPVAWQSFYFQCTRIYSLEALSWSMFALCILGLLWAFFEVAMWRSKRKNKHSASASEAGLNHSDNNEKFDRITSNAGASEASGLTGPGYSTDNAQWGQQGGAPGTGPGTNANP